MANYNIQYRMEFQDIYLSSWRVDFLLKNGIENVTPIRLTGTGTPIKFDKKNNNEYKFEPIIKTQCSIQYLYQGLPGEPSPETFIVIDNDDWQVQVYQDGLIKWRGFINPDNNLYDWVPAPFAFMITATDFSFSEGQKMNFADDEGRMVYDHITIGDFINRTLFHTVGYDDPVLNIVYSKKPDVIGAGNITDSLYVHTDAFYDFEKGEMFAYDALKRFVSSIGARLFHWDGAYWLQYISDIGSALQPILQITPGNLSGEVITQLTPFSYMGNGPGDSVVYNSNTQQIMINRSLKQKNFTYKLKAINQLKNFDWRDYTPPRTLPNWTVNPTLNIDRMGSGTINEPYRLRVYDRLPGQSVPRMEQAISVLPGQRLRIQIKVNGHYARDFGIGVRLGDVLADPSYVMDSAGNWGPRLTPGTDNTLFPVSIPNTDTVTVDILTAAIPADAQEGTAYLVLSYPRPVLSGIPPGEQFYIDYYPVSMQRYNDLFVQFDETISNDAKFSFVADPEELFFLDKQDANLSNNLFWDNGGVKEPLPLKNWSGENLDEYVTKQQGIQQAERTINVIGTFSSNSLDFQQSILLRDKSLLPTFMLRESYEVKQGRRSITAVEQLVFTTQTINWTVVPKTKEVVNAGN